MATFDIPELTYVETLKEAESYGLELSREEISSLVDKVNKSWRINGNDAGDIAGYYDDKFSFPIPDEDGIKPLEINASNFSEVFTKIIMKHIKLTLAIELDHIKYGDRIN